VTAPPRPAGTGAPAGSVAEATAGEPSTEEVESTAGPAHVATCSFLASRATPSGGFFVALAGGTALARVGQRRGLREGYGASVAAVIETVAIMGPARFGVPFTQALGAPLLGRMQARGFGALAQWLVCAAIRVLSNAGGLAFFVWVIAGGLDAYAGTYDALAGRLGFDLGVRGALLLSLAGLIGWGAFASVVQVTVYRRGLARWPERSGAGVEASEEAPARRGRFDPRAVALAAAIAFALLLAGTSWPLLGAASGWLALAWVASRPDRRAVPTGLVLAALLAAGSFVFVLGGGLGLELALRRAGRAALLVLVATWLRAAAGTDGLREVARRMLGRLRVLPSVPEAAHTLDRLGSEGRLLAAGHALVAAVGRADSRPGPLIDAVLGWVPAEAARYRPGAPAAPLALRAGTLDVALVVLTAAVGLALLA
jgi:hypothetical protein